MQKVVVKVGTKVLSQENGLLDVSVVESLVDQIVMLERRDTQIILVSSGAVGAGKSLVTTSTASSKEVEKQLYAAVGQIRLMSLYAKLFGYHERTCAQVLATKMDFKDKNHHKTMHNCLSGLLENNITPIVNENDVVATEELMFTDNDELAGLVAELVGADTLIILTTTNGILDDRGETVKAVCIDTADEVERYVQSEVSDCGRGGMASKFTVAKRLSQKGIPVCIADGKNANVLSRIIQGEEIGTRFIVS